MAHPLLWPKKTFFYPVGNTAAVSLVDHLNPDEDANVLLLGCGDPRSILYTSYATRADITASSRKFDFTCCDIEPAILARNVILFTLIADDGALDRMQKIWNIFYHFYLDESSLAFLVEHCEKLIEVSKTPDTWRNSQYGQFLRICTTDTLEELRRLWALYVKTTQASDREKTRFKDAFTAGAKARLADTLKIHGSVSTAGRSAGPYQYEAMKIVPELFKRYWETGLISSDAKEVEKAKCVNPTFAFAMSGEAFPAHYGTDPLSSFHLAEAIAPIKGDRGAAKTVNLCSTARAQFRQWCSSFKTSIGDGKCTTKIIVRIFVGDGIAFSRALLHCAVNQSPYSTVYTAPWRATRIILDNAEYGKDAPLKAPLSFNVIDTSNLTDHVGLLNLLIATTPLLSKCPSSTTYTEILLSSEGDATSGFVERVCADIPAFSLLLGLAPLAYVSGFSSHSNVHEILSHCSDTSSLQYRERIAWKVAAMGDITAINTEPGVDGPFMFDAKSLAKLLFGIYHKMFADEDKAAMMQNFSRHAMMAQNNIHYIRGTFAAFLKIVKNRVLSHWPTVMSTLDDFLISDKKFLVGANNYQDLCCQLHFLGVHTIEMLLPRQTAQLDKSQGRFRKWAIVPPIVCVVLSVPRSKIKVLEDIPADTIKTPIIHCEVNSGHGHAIFSSIHAIFGKLRSTGPEEDPIAIIDADPLGWSGISAMIVSFWIPSWILMMAPPASVISLSVRSTLSTVLLVPKLGMALRLFSASVMDERHVTLVKERPSLPGELRNNAIAPFQPEAEARHTLQSNVHAVTVNLDDGGHKVVSLTARADIVKENAKISWSSGAPIAIHQISPCAVRIVCGDMNQALAFPFPIDGNRIKLRIARKSFYVEAVVPISTQFTTDGYRQSNFPVIIQSGHAPTVWNIHHLQLDRVPALDVDDIHKLRWIDIHVALMMSDRQRLIRTKQMNTKSTPRDVLVDVKDSIYSMLISASGTQGYRARVFGLTEPSMGGIYTLIFVNDLRLDLASHTVVADTCILPLTTQTDQVISNALLKLQNGGVLQVKTIGDEMQAWKRLLPAFIERCREWKHREDCEYTVGGVVPLSLELAQSPICTCGRGIGLSAFRKVKEWKHLAPYVTRAAIGPLFAVSYLDGVATTLKEALFSAETKLPGLCVRCGGGGNPKLLACSNCHTLYCSRTCQKEDWKRHKRQCN